MRVSIMGLGYVGCVSAACLAQDGHEVIGVDVNEQKLAMLKAGESPIIEQGLDDSIAQGVAAGQLRVTSDAHLAVLESDVTLVCVGTPSQRNGSLDLEAVKEVSRQIGAALADKDDYHCVVVRSTVLPGTVREELLPLISEASGKAVGEEFGVAMNPEFLREGSAISDFYDPSYTVIGSYDGQAGDTVEKLYTSVDAPVIHTDIETAEMVKYANNAFHALKVAFANEIGTVAKSHGVDGRQVMEILCRDERLNISPTYLRPGFAYGGSCLPKDLRAIAYRARERDLSMPLLEGISASNDAHVRRGLELIERTGRRSVGVVGLSFKPGTDDVRESPIVPMVETLVGRGYDVSVFDNQVLLSRLMGKNKEFLEREIPHIASLMRPELSQVIDDSEVVVVTNANPVFAEVASLLRDGQVLVDLAGLDGVDGMKGSYDGICW